MEETGRPRKAQKLEHATTDSAGDGAVSTAPDCEKSAQEVTGIQASPNETSNGHADKDETGETEAASATGTEKESSAAPPISKNQLKKQLRQEKWEAGREFRKAKKKEKLKEKKEKKRAAREQGAHDAPDAGENGASEVSGAGTAEARKPRTLLPVTFILDCGYDELMTDKERTSLASQLTRGYSDNVRSRYRAHLTVSSFNGLLKERFDGVLGKTHKHWKGVTFMQDNYMAAAEVAKGEMRGPTGGEMAGLFSGKADTSADEEGEVVYLTSDSPDTLTELKPYSTYIIGGLVDKNRHKGICYKSALDKGIKTAKLPIGDYMKMNSRFVLATNHVVEIMLRWLELGNWGEAFIQVMPKRKGGELKGKKDEATPEQQAEEKGTAADETGEQEATAAEEATEETADSKVQDTDNN